jgi:hypothetical protein
LKILNTKRAGGVAQGVGPEFKPQYHHQKKKKGFFKDGCGHMLRGESGRN